MVVLLAADAKFRRPLDVCAGSIRAHNPDAEIIVLGPDRIDPALIGGARLPTHLPEACLYRLLAPDLFPRLDRIVYLDVDTLVKGSLDDLAALDLGGRMVGAVRDALVPFASMALPWRDLGIPPERPYFNSGVMVVDLALWRRDRIGPRAIELLRERDLAYADQGALNLVCDWKPLSPRWNLQQAHLTDASPIWSVEGKIELDQAVASPAILHFNGRIKPWEAGCPHPRAAEWAQAAGFTPSRSLRARTRSLIRG
jgi:lipopolysaccharide biosynthesis glycosyltransferase